MTAIKIGSLAIVAMIASASAQPPQPAERRPAQPAQQTPEAVLKEIEQTFGFVPQFFRQIPAAMLPGFWVSMRDLELAQNTKLDAKTKELIGLAVASQVPCDYCTRFHREAARLHGASEEELREAVGMAAMTRLGSTLLNGIDVDKQQFQRDVERIVRTQRQQAQRGQQPKR
jgi:AhpD family alkylhydroperoxidase